MQTGTGSLGSVRGSVSLSSGSVKTFCPNCERKGAGRVLVVDVERRGAGDPRWSIVTVCTRSVCSPVRIVWARVRTWDGRDRRLP